MKRLLVCALAVSAVACQEYPFAFQTNQRVNARSYQQQIATEGKTDILFVVDNSGSMAAKQANLQANAAAFIRTLTDSVNDYQVGIISTDMLNVPVEGQSTCDPCCDLDTDGDGIPDFSNCDGGRLVAADGFTRFFRRPSSDDPAELEQQILDLVNGFNANIGALGTGGSAYEAAFNAMRAALDPDSDVGVRALNFRFIRPDADLAIIFVTDEDDCSFADDFYTQGLHDSQCYIQSQNAFPVSDFLSFLGEIKGDIRNVRAAAIYGSVRTDDVANHRLGNRAAGCFTDTLAGEGTSDGYDASAECGCWEVQFLPDRSTSDPTDDYYCNLTANPPYNQLRTRTPDRGNDQGGCLAVPGSRYETFLNELDSQRTQLGQNAGVLADSICRSDYGRTLQAIIETVILSNCFNLVEPPAGFDQIGIDFSTANLSDRVVLLQNGEALFQVPTGSDEPGWSYQYTEGQPPRICLEGGVIKRVNDVFEFTVISDLTGFEDQTTP